MIRISALLAAQFLIAIAAKATSVSVTNLSSDDVKEAPVVVALPDAGSYKSVEIDGKRVGVQADDLDGNGTPEELVFLAPLKANETKSFKLSAEAPETPLTKRTHAGMYLKTPEMKGMEGPGWESDRIAFRIYWDARNATDVFCKSEPILSLDAYAANKHDYHVNSKYGMDVLKVGTALGIGGFGILDDKKVVKVAEAKREFKLLANGPIRSVCDFVYTDWNTSSGRKLALNARQLIYAGQLWGECQLTLKALDAKQLPPLVAGVVLHKGVQIVKYGDLGIAGTFGNQQLGDNQKPNSGDLGLGVTADPAAIASVGIDPVNLYLQFEPTDGKATFRYTASWTKQPDGAKTAVEFKDYMARIQRQQVKVSLQP